MDAILIGKVAEKQTFFVKFAYYFYGDTHLCEIILNEFIE